jgi:hypothetical protein
LGVPFRRQRRRSRKSAGDHECVDPQV